MSQIFPTFLFMKPFCSGKRLRHYFKKYNPTIGIGWKDGNFRKFWRYWYRSRL